MQNCCTLLMSQRSLSNICVNFVISPFHLLGSSQPMLFYFNVYLCTDKYTIVSLTDYYTNMCTLLSGAIPHV